MSWRRAKADPITSGFLLLALAFCALVPFQLTLSFAEAMRHAEARAVAGALALEEHMSRTFGEVESAMLSLHGVCPEAAFLERGQEERVHELFVAMLGRLPQIASVVAVNANGNVFAEANAFPTNRRFVGDRDYVRVHRPGVKPALHVAAPIASRLDNSALVPLSAPLTDEAGHQCGVVSVGLNPGYFADFYRRFLDEEDAVISLRREDGALLVRVPPGDVRSSPPPDG